MTRVLYAAKLVAAWAAAVLALAFATAVVAAPSFPALTGRVVDAANILSADTETSLTAKLKALEDTTGRQLVVATIPSLGGYPIDDYGYQLGRTWGIGAKGRNDGAILIVAPNERQVRVEVGYGLEPVLTDTLSFRVIREDVLPRFRDKDMEGGVVAGADGLIRQLSLPDAEARQNVAKAAAAPQPVRHGIGIGGFVTLLIIFLVISSIFRGRRRGGGGLGSAWWLAPMIFSGRGGGGGWKGGGGGDWGGGGGGGFSGGGGSFGGGGASGSW